MDTYEKKYKEALELARVAAFNGHQSLMEGIFPELAESEDEKTRKRIIALVNAHGQGMYKDDMLTWLENIPYTIDHEKREGFHLGYKAGLEKQGQKETKETSVWHEYNDKIDLNRPFLLITPKGQLSIMSWNGKSLKSVTFGGGGGIILEGDRFAYIDDLEKQGEQASAWSEKDEKEYKYVLKFVDNILNNCGNKKDYEHCKRCYDWLKSLKDRYTWKPSDEQITVLELASKYERVFTPKQIDILIDLKEQLKKLKGE